MEAKTKKYLKIGGIIFGSLVAIYGGYKGHMYIQNKINSDADLKGKDTEVTLPDGTVITVTADALKPPSDNDLNDLSTSAIKAGFGTTNLPKLRAAALSKLKRYEVQRLTFLFDKAVIGISGVTGLNATQLAEFNALIKKLY